MRSPLLIAGLLLLMPGFSPAQTDTIVTRARIMDGDTIPLIELTEIPILAHMLHADPVEAKRFATLVRNVKRVYPYAKLAGMRFNELNEKMESGNGRKDRKKAIDAVEDEIINKYGDELKKLTFTQGKILIKLLDRETGNSSFYLVRELKGKMLAFFYQGFAKVWGFNLKTKYDPNGEDREIEQIILLIEKGAI